MITFDEILSSIKEYMILEGNDDFIVDLLLGTAISIELNRPVWLMIIAPPSSGKTELLNLLSVLENYHPLYNLTPRFLFSGHPNAQGGYMIRKVKEKGIVAFPDFTTVLSVNSKARNEIFNQLRVMFDCKAGLGTGIDTGKLKSWEGKIAVISLVTEKVEILKEKSTDLGERFLYYSYVPKYKEDKVFVRNDFNISNKENVPQIVKEFLDSKRIVLSKYSINSELKMFLIGLSKFIAIGRSTVQRDGHGREIAFIHRPEEPYRIMNVLSSLFVSMINLNEDIIRTKRILRKLAFSSIPMIRSNILYTIQNTNKLNITFDDIYASFKLSESRIRRVIEDLNAIGVLEVIPSGDSNKKHIKIAEKFHKYWKVVYKKG